MTDEHEGLSCPIRLGSLRSETSEKENRILAGDILGLVWSSSDDLQGWVYSDRVDRLDGCDVTVRIIECAALAQLRAEGYQVRAEDSARLSPRGFEHINMLGHYAFNLPDTIARGELRSLRDPASASAETVEIAITLVFRSAAPQAPIRLRELLQ